MGMWLRGAANSHTWWPARGEEQLVKCIQEGKEVTLNHCHPLAAHEF